MISLSRASFFFILSIGSITFLSLSEAVRKLGITPLFLPLLTHSPFTLSLSLSLSDSEKVSVGVQAAGASCEKWSHLFSLALTAGFPHAAVTRTHTVHPDFLRHSNLQTFLPVPVPLFTLVITSLLCYGGDIYNDRKVSI